MKLIFASVLFIASITPSWALAQSTDDPWTDPLNLSRSGVAAKPSIVIDSDETIHVIWQDDTANFSYTQFDGAQWSTPELTDLNRLFRLPDPDEPADPFQLANYSGPNPLFIAGPDQRIFAFWITPEGRVYISNVENQKFKDRPAWGSGRLVTLGAASFASTIDARGELHFAFLRPEGDDNNPPGIYYMRSQNNGGDWTKPVLLYESPYLRTLGQGEAHLSLATSGTKDVQHIYVTWDNRSRKQVFLAQSADSGVTWKPPVLVAGSAPNSGVAGPFGIQVGANQDSVVLVWQSGRPGGSCSLVHQFSSNSGATWSDPEPMIEDLLGCAESNQFVTVLANRPEGLLYFLTETQSQVFLTAWNGMEWSQPQAQPVLSGFEEPEIYTEVIYGCRRTALLQKRLYVVGCDQGGGGDVWVTSRDLGSNRSWFEPPVWSALLPITSDHPAVEAVELVATDDGLIHAFFSQDQDSDIYYTYWNGELWSRIAPVLTLPDGEAGRPTIAASPRNELFLIAPSDRGALYFSRATSGNAATESRWSTPERLEIAHDGEIGSVNMALDATGTISVAYSVPVNEERGIYLIQSKDDGASWSEPLQVFNGSTAGFDVVGAPSVVTSGNGLLHILWNEQSIQGDGVTQPLALFYARSEDRGETFSDAELVVEEAVSWREMVNDDKGNLHLLWQSQDTMNTIWDQVSLDGGRTWQFPQGLPDEGTNAAIVVDSMGRLNLVDAGPSSLGHWFWDGSRWQPEETLHWSLEYEQESPVELLAAAANKQGKIVVALVIPMGAGDIMEKTLFYSARALENPGNEVQTEEVTTQTSLPPTRTPSTPVPELSSTPLSTADSEPANSQGQTDRNETGSRISPMTMALVPVALLLLIVLGMVIRRAMRAEDR